MIVLNLQRLTQEILRMQEEAGGTSNEQGLQDKNWSSNINCFIGKRFIVYNNQRLMYERWDGHTPQISGTGEISPIIDGTN